LETGIGKSPPLECTGTQFYQFVRSKCTGTQSYQLRLDQSQIALKAGSARARVCDMCQGHDELCTCFTIVLVINLVKIHMHNPNL